LRELLATLTGLARSRHGTSDTRMQRTIGTPEPVRRSKGRTRAAIEIEITQKSHKPTFWRRLHRSQCLRPTLQRKRPRWQSSRSWHRAHARKTRPKRSRARDAPCHFTNSESAARPMCVCRFHRALFASFVRFVAEVQTEAAHLVRAMDPFVMPVRSRLAGRRTSWRSHPLATRYVYLARYLLPFPDNGLLKNRRTGRFNTLTKVAYYPYNRSVPRTSLRVAARERHCHLQRRSHRGVLVACLNAARYPVLLSTPLVWS
jgi:hypothetical protein